MKKLLFLLPIILILSGCNTSKQTIQKSGIKYDTVFIEKKEILKDTFIIQKPDSAIIKALIKCKEGRAYIEKINTTNGVKIKTKIILKHDTLRVKAIIDSAAIYFAYKQKFVNTYKGHSEKKKEITKKEVTKKRLPAACWYGIIAVLLYIIVKYFPIIVKFLIKFI